MQRIHPVVVRTVRLSRSVQLGLCMRGSLRDHCGAEPIIEHNDLRRVELLKELGYDGTPVVVLQITDRPFLNAAAVVTRQRLEKVGFKVVIEAMDWSTHVVVRARKEPPRQGRLEFALLVGMARM